MEASLFERQTVFHAGHVVFSNVFCLRGCFGFWVVFVLDSQVVEVLRLTLVFEEKNVILRFWAAHKNVRHDTQHTETCANGWNWTLFFVFQNNGR